METMLEIFTEMGAELLEVLPYFVAGVLLEAYIRTKKWHIKIRKIV